MPDHDLAALVGVSRLLGADPAFVQGGGGNTSVKISGGMWVKASGLALADVTTERGFVLVDDAAIRAGLAACRTEADYSALLRSSLRFEGGGRPSIETGVHALLGGRVVLHSHAIAANLLCCATDGRALARAVLPDAVWVPYATPGLPITQAIAAAVATGPTPGVLLLQNHGLIVSGDDPDAAWKRHDAVCRAIAAHFQVDVSAALAGEAVAADAEHALFPDQVVYLQHPQLRYSKAGEETLQAYSALRTLLPRLGQVPRYLAGGEVDILVNMEAEKYRQKVAGA